MTKKRFYKDKSANLKIAIIGAGISGLTTALLLSKKYEVSLYEASNNIGGHALTIKEKILNNGEYNSINFDVGFLVYNNKNYPLFSSMLNKLKVESIDSNMSFAVSNKNLNFEYGSAGILAATNSFKNIFFFNFWKMFFGIRKFYKISNKLINSNSETSLNMTTEEFLENNKFNKVFIFNHFLPMCGAIWSVSFLKVLKMPIKTILYFFNNHGLLSFFNKPKWRTIRGGSKNYVMAMLKKINGNIYVNEKVNCVIRNKKKIIIKSKNFSKIYDKVIFAVHSDDIVKLISNPSKDEVDAFTYCKYENNKIYVHQDKKLLPINKKVWSSWNVISNNQKAEKKLFNKNICVTYWVNKLQNFTSDEPVLVTLNPDNSNLPDKEKILKVFNFRHPFLNKKNLSIKEKVITFQGHNNTYFTGAWLGYGFHEDGVKSAFDLMKYFDIDIKENAISS